MTLRDQILAVLADQPGLTDRELTELVKSKGAGQQAVNGECRLLRNQHVLRRTKREDGRLGNYLIDRKAPAEAGDLWDREEIEAAVVAYLGMLAEQQAGAVLNKKQVNRDLRAGLLAGRSPTSVERRMQNITAVLAQLGQPTLDGYVPLRNVGRNWDIIVAVATPRLDGLPDALVASRDIDVPPTGNEQPERTQRTSMVFKRDQKVVDWVLKRAGAFCEGCLHEAPFYMVGDVPYLEVHHVQPLAAGGPDTVANAVALCPNCHCKAHYAAGNVLREFEKTLISYLDGLN